jgi:tRNA dimethylallyltransferase
MEVDGEFRRRVEALVAQIPKGRVMTYGQLAALCGNARAARIVGGIAHFGDPDLPWQRVVNRHGGLAAGYPGGREGHKQVLEEEGVHVNEDYKVNIQELLWMPGQEQGRLALPLSDSNDSGHQGAAPDGPAAPPTYRLGTLSMTSEQPDTTPSRPSYRNNPKEGVLVVIVGETASGKTALAIELAKRFDGEIICADSRTVYKRMDIGTAKPSKKEQAAVRHHLLDIVNPDERFTAADFKQLANKAITDISARDKLPILVGGTGLYIDAVLYDYSFAAPDAGRDPRNPRHVAQAESGSKNAPRPNTLILGLSQDREVLRERITARVGKMIAAGFIAELKILADTYGWDAPALQAPGYKAFHEYLDSALNLDESKALFVQNDLRLAKRQRTWFKRNNSIHWISNRGEAVEITTTFLSKTTDQTT